MSDDGYEFSEEELKEKLRYIRTWENEAAFGMLKSIVFLEKRQARAEVTKELDEYKDRTARYAKEYKRQEELIYQLQEIRASSRIDALREVQHMLEKEAKDTVWLSDGCTVWDGIDHLIGKEGGTQEWEAEIRASERKAVQESWKQLIKDEREGAAKEAYVKGYDKALGNSDCFKTGFKKGQVDLIEKLTSEDAIKAGFEVYCNGKTDRDMTPDEVGLWCITKIIKAAIKKASESLGMGSYGSPTEEVYPPKPEKPIYNTFSKLDDAES